MKFLITGVSSGIGFEVAKRLLEMNHEVIGISRREPIKLKTFEKLSFYPVDLSQVNELEVRLKHILTEHPVIEGVISSAGYGLFGQIEQFSFSKIQNLFNVNFLSNTLLTKVFLPSMQKRQQGSFIFVGSEAALQGKASGSIYCASKFALRGFCQSLRKDCSKSNVKVSLINPGFVLTPFFDHLNFKPGDDISHYCNPSDVAKLIIDQLFAPQNMVIDEINLSPQKQVMQKNNLKMALEDSNC